MDTTGNVVFDYEVTGSAVSSINTGSILNGDVDGWYTIIIMCVSGADATHYIRPNGDTGANYGFLGTYAISTTVASASATGGTGMWAGYNKTSKSSLSVFTMYAKSGAVRLGNATCASSINGTGVELLYGICSVWNNTADNITSMKIEPSRANGFGVGTRVIILKGNALAVGTSPGTTGAWKRVGTSVLGSAASSVTFSGLNGDTAVCYYLSGQIKASASYTYFPVRLNNDSGANYRQQFLRAENTTASANNFTNRTFLLGNIGGASSGKYINSMYLIFAKSGFLRPAINFCSDGILGTEVYHIQTSGECWSNTADNISNIVVPALDKDFTAGSQFDLYALYSS